MGHTQFKRIIIALPNDLISQLDEGAKQQLMSRTGYIRFLLLEAANDQAKVAEAAYQAARRYKLKQYLDRTLEAEEA